MEDWYTVKISDFEQYGGARLLKMFQHSPSKILSTVYKEHEWFVILDII